MYPTITLRQDRTNPLVRRHPWVYSGAIERVPDDVTHGDTVRVSTHDEQVVGVGQYSAKSMIAVRLYDFADVTIDRQWLQRRIVEANARRLLMIPELEQSPRPGYRVVFGESDWLPGLVTDRFNDVLVIQVTNAAMERWRKDLVAILCDLFSPRAIYERSDLPGGANEGLKESTGPVFGETPGLAEFDEAGIKFLADVEQGQKTGFFLDQRRVRKWVRRLATNRNVADLFCYSGAMGISALSGGASRVTYVDSSAHALSLVQMQLSLNAVDSSRTETHEADVFQWLGQRSEPEYDMIILDPPALIKSRKHAEAGRKGYHFLNRAAMRLMHDGGILVSSSCSQFLSEDDLQVTVRRAADQAGVTANLLASIGQAADHPTSLYFPEAKYLKTVICEIRR